MVMTIYIICVLVKSLHVVLRFLKQSVQERRLNDQFDSGVGSGIGSGTGIGLGSGVGSGIGSGIGSGTGTGLGIGGGCSHLFGSGSVFFLLLKFPI